MKAISLAAAALLALGVGACGDGGSAGPATLTGGVWVVEEIGGTKMTAPAPTIEFRPDGRFGGVASCNSYGGSYTDEGGRVGLSGVFATKMACEPRRMAQEKALFDALGSGGGYSVSAERLTIEGAQRIEAKRVLAGR